MEKKRATAAEVFNQQYIQQASEEATDEFSKTDALLGATPPPLRPPAAPAPPAAKKAALPMNLVKTSEELQMEKEPMKIRETGFAFWKRVIVPPNAYVVHTRTGRTEPVTLGLGVSFRYNPYTDAYLVVPAAMQTIGVVANCITKEKQGINVLAYVQWQIHDFAVAYRKLDFSDPRDPLAIVNAQLGEQAEAAIKDKIATMSVEEVLTDKAPVIEELTTRLKAVAEGRNQGGEAKGEGLGIKIITVQIREALVSSQRLWQDLQAPFRHQQARIARISELSMQTDIREKELETRRMNEIREAETLVAIERTTQSKKTEAAELQAEANKRQKTLHIEEHLHALTEDGRLAVNNAQAVERQLERDTALKKLEADAKAALQQKEDEYQAQILETRLARQQRDHAAQLTLQEQSQQLTFSLEKIELEHARIRQEIRNAMNERDLLRQFIEKLPEIAAQMPKIQELKVLQTGSGNASFDTFAAFLADALAAAEHVGLRWPSHQPKPPSEQA